MKNYLHVYLEMYLKIRHFKSFFATSLTSFCFMSVKHWWHFLHILKMNSKDVYKQPINSLPDSLWFYLMEVLALFCAPWLERYLCTSAIITKNLKVNYCLWNLLEAFNAARRVGRWWLRGKPWLWALCYALASGALLSTTTRLLLVLE